MMHSIKKQFAGIFIVLMTGTILACLLINNIFLEKYYFSNKKKALLGAYNKINMSDISSDRFDIEIKKICWKYNISVIIMDADSQILKASGNDVDILGRQLLDNLFGRVENNDILEEKTVLSYR